MPCKVQSIAHEIKDDLPNRFRENEQEDCKTKKASTTDNDYKLYLIFILLNEPYHLGPTHGIGMFCPNDIVFTSSSEHE